MRRGAISKLVIFRGSRWGGRERKQGEGEGGGKREGHASCSDRSSDSWEKNSTEDGRDEGAGHIVCQDPIKVRISEMGKRGGGGSLQGGRSSVLKKRS